MDKRPNELYRSSKRNYKQIKQHIIRYAKAEAEKQMIQKRRISAN